jgi:hypothetical protein
MSDLRNTVLISTGIVAALPLIAIGHFLCFGWPARKEQILSRFTDDSIKHYRETFCPRSKFTNTAEFEKNYDARYGRRLFFFPVLLFAAAVIFLSSLGVSWVWSHDWLGAGESTGKIAIWSLAGAYIWVTYDLIFRVRQNDVVTSDINRATLRLLLSMPFGFAITTFADAVDSTHVRIAAGALAFFVGAFPTDTVIKFMRRTAFLSLKLDANANDDSLKQLLKIDGITTPVAERLVDEGIRTNLQLAYADPISLTIKTGMDFAFIVSCCGHAMVRTYFNDRQMEIVEKYGLLSGLEMITLNKALLDCDKLCDDAKNDAKNDAKDGAKGTAAMVLNAEQDRAQLQLQNFSAALQLDPASTRFIIDQIAEDPYVAFTWWMWPDTQTGTLAPAVIKAAAPAEEPHEVVVPVTGQAAE